MLAARLAKILGIWDNKIIIWQTEGRCLRTAVGFQVEGTDSSWLNKGRHCVRMKLTISLNH
jgi:hypothetical protein